MKLDMLWECIGLIQVISGLLHSIIIHILRLVNFVTRVNQQSFSVCQGNVLGCSRWANSTYVSCNSFTSTAEICFKFQMFKPDVRGRPTPTAIATADGGNVPETASHWLLPPLLLESQVGQVHESKKWEIVSGGLEMFMRCSSIWKRERYWGFQTRMVYLDCISL